MKKLMTILTALVVLGITGGAQAANIPLKNPGFDDHGSISDDMTSNTKKDNYLPEWTLLGAPQCTGNDPASGEPREVLVTCSHGHGGGGNGLYNTGAHSSPNKIRTSRNAGAGGAYQRVVGTVYQASTKYTFSLYYAESVVGRSPTNSHGVNAFRMALCNGDATDHTQMNDAIVTTNLAAYSESTGWTQLSVTLDTSVLTDAVGKTIEVKFVGQGHNTYDTFQFYEQFIDSASLTAVGTDDGAVLTIR